LIISDSPNKDGWRASNKSSKYFLIFWQMLSSFFRALRIDDNLFMSCSTLSKKLSLLLLNFHCTLNYFWYNDLNGTGNLFARYFWRSQFLDILCQIKYILASRLHIVLFHYLKYSGFGKSILFSDCASILCKANK